MFEPSPLCAILASKTKLKLNASSPASPKLFLSTLCISWVLLILPSFNFNLVSKPDGDTSLTIKLIFWLFESFNWLS